MKTFVFLSIVLFYVSLGFLLEKAGYDCLDRHVSDWGKIKNDVKNALGDYFWKETRRNPMILPVIMEV